MGIHRFRHGSTSLYRSDRKGTPIGDNDRHSVSLAFSHWEFYPFSKKNVSSLRPVTRHSSRNSTTTIWESIPNSANQNLAKAKRKLISRSITMRGRWRTQPQRGSRRIKILLIQQCMKILANSSTAEPPSSLSLSRAALFAKSKNVMLSHLFADAIEEEGAGAKGGGGKKKGGGSMQTISATHRVRHP